MLQLFIGSPPTPIYADMAGVMMGHVCGIFLPYWYFKWLVRQAGRDRQPGGRAGMSMHR